MYFSVSRFFISVWLVLYLVCFPALAQDANKVRATVDQLNDLVHRAENGERGFKLSSSAPRSITLLTIEGVPVLAYQKHVIGWLRDEVDFTADCSAPGVLRLTYGVMPYGDKKVPAYVQPGFVADVLIRSNDLGLDNVLPEAATILDVKEADDNGFGASKVFRTSIEIPANGRIASALGPTGNLQVVLKEGSEYLRLSGGAGLNGYEKDLRPLVEHCARTDPNYTPPPPTVAEIAEQQPIRRYPTPEQLQVALSNYYGRAVGVYSFAAGDGDTGFEYEDFELYQCISTENDLVYCRFSGRMLFGGRNLEPIVNLVNAMMAIAGPRWVSLSKESSSWEVNQDYQDCELRTDSIYCDWYD